METDWCSTLCTPETALDKKMGGEEKRALAFKCLTHEPDHVVEEAGELLDTAKGNLW